MLYRLCKNTKLHWLPFPVFVLLAIAGELGVQHTIASVNNTTLNQSAICGKPETWLTESQIHQHQPFLIYKGNTEPPWNKSRIFWAISAAKDFWNGLMPVTQCMKFEVSVDSGTFIFSCYCAIQICRNMTPVKFLLLSKVCVCKW